MSLLAKGERKDGKFIRTQYEQKHLLGFFLGRAREHAQYAAALPDPFPGKLSESEVTAAAEHCLLVLIFSSLALEAGANEFAENLLPEEAWDRFAHAKKEFQPKADVSRCIWKWKILFEKLGVTLNLSDPPLAGAEELIQARHVFEHYKPTDAATKWIFEGPLPGGENATTADEMRETMRMELSAMDREMRPLQALVHYRACRALFLEWWKAKGRRMEELDAVMPVI